MTENPQHTNIDDYITPSFFIFSEKYSIGTPKGLGKSPDYIEMPFKEFAKNYELQSELELPTAELEKIAQNPKVDPSKKENLSELTACYLSNCIKYPKDPEMSTLSENYLNNNGLVTIVITDKNLLEKVKKII